MDTTVTERSVVEKALSKLPDDALSELIAYMEFLQFKHTQDIKGDTVPFKPVNLPEGILEGYDFSPELIAQARHELWATLEKGAV